MTEERYELSVLYARLEDAIHTLMSRHIALTRAARAVIAAYDRNVEQDVDLLNLDAVIDALRSELTPPPGKDSRQ